MTLRIQCPSCDRQFKVGEDLKGRTVECGACEHRFKVDDGVVVQKKDKFYPGETGKAGLERFGRVPTATNVPVKFQTAAYNQTSSPLDVIPMSPQEWFAAMAGACVLAGTILLFVWGTQPRGFLKDMEVGPRTVLAGFMVVVGTALIAYGCRHRRKAGFLVALPLAGTAIALSLLMPVPRTLVPINEVGSLSDPVEQVEEPVKRIRKNSEEVRELIGYKPVEQAIESHKDDEGDPAEYVSVIWILSMEERYKFQVWKYLQRTTKSEERPGFYRRGEGGIFVIDGPRMPIDEVAKLAERIGHVEEIYPDIRVVEVRPEDGRLMDASPELMSKLTDSSHQAFYVRNQQELEHLDLDRVRSAVSRLADVQPLRFRIEITRRFLSLLQEETDPELQNQLCRALQVWAEDGDDSDKVVAEVARQLLAQDQTLPRSMVEFLVQRQSPEAVTILEPLWVKDPVSWEPIMAEIGPAAEEAALRYLESDSRALQHSSIRILKRVGNEGSLAPLRAAKAGADDETSLLLDEVIGSIETNP